MSQNTNDELVHKIVSRDSPYLKLYPLNGEITVPTEPYISGTPETKTVSCEWIELKECDTSGLRVDDGGLTVWGNLKFSREEWKRLGFNELVDHPRAKRHEILTDDYTYRTELVAMRDHFSEPVFHESVPNHGKHVPHDSPLLKEWRETVPEDERGVYPAYPFETPYIKMIVPYGEQADSQTHGFDIITLTEINHVEAVNQTGNDYTTPSLEDDEITLPKSVRPIVYKDALPLEPTTELLEAIFTLNKHAEQLFDKSISASKHGKDAQAKICLVQKNALHKIKSDVLHRFAKYASKNNIEIEVEKHKTVGDSVCWCLNISDEYSFHIPVEKTDSKMIQTLCDNPESVTPEQIEKPTINDSESLPMTTKRALQTLKKYNIEPDEYLEKSLVASNSVPSEKSTEFTY